MKSVPAGGGADNQRVEYVYRCDNQNPMIAGAVRAMGYRFPAKRVLRGGTMVWGGRLLPVQLMGDLSVRVLSPDRNAVICWSQPGAYRGQP